MNPTSQRIRPRTTIALRRRAGFLAPAELGLALAGLTGWLARHDVARATIHSTGLPRYAAGCLLAGYAWLAVAATIWLIGAPTLDGARYDAVVHAILLGFTLSMIMAHAPVILPAVLRRPLPYRAVLIGPVVLLQASLVLRRWAGDGLRHQQAWLVGGMLNILAVLAFAAAAAWSALRGPVEGTRR